MALRNNKAAKLNRFMMFGMLALAIIVLGCVFSFLYLSSSKDPFMTEMENKAQADSTLVIEVVGDSALIDSLSE